MLRIKVTLFLLFFSLFNSVYAEELDYFSIIFQGGSIHSNASGMNENHGFIGLCFNEFCGMKFRNSFDDPGDALFIKAKFLETKYFDAGFLLGLIWGYDTSPLVMTIPHFSFGCKHFHINVSFLPSPAFDGNFVAAHFFEFRLINTKF